MLSRRRRIQHRRFRTEPLRPARSRSTNGQAGSSAGHAARAAHVGTLSTEGQVAARRDVAQPFHRADSQKHASRAFACRSCQTLGASAVRHARLLQKPSEALVPCRALAHPSAAVSPPTSVHPVHHAPVTVCALRLLQRAERRRCIATRVRKDRAGTGCPPQPLPPPLPLPHACARSPAGHT